MFIYNKRIIFFNLTENKNFTKVKKRTKKYILPYLVRCNLTGTRLYITIKIIIYISKKNHIYIFDV